MTSERVIRLSSGLLTAAMLAFVSSTPSAKAGQPQVQFDAASAIACRDITPPNPLGIRTDSKLIEVRFRVSILVVEGRQDEIEDVIVQIGNPQRRLRVIDFSPKTEMANTADGEVQTTHTTENSATAGAQIGGGAIPLYGLASAQLGASQRQVVAQTYKELPGKCMVLASGTTHSEHGVFFKIKGSPQISLEGEKEFTCIFEVPMDWRGDWCILSCQARGLSQHYLSKVIEPCGHVETFVGLYLIGDREGEEISRQLDALQALPGSSERLAVDLIMQADRYEYTADHPQPFDLSQAFSSWSRLQAFFESYPERDAQAADRTNSKLKQTLSELGARAGQ